MAKSSKTFHRDFYLSWPPLQELNTRGDEDPGGILRAFPPFLHDIGWVDVPFRIPHHPIAWCLHGRHPPKYYGSDATRDIVQLGLMGVLAVQLYLFYENSKDRLAIKTLVYVLALLDIVQTVMVTADAFHWFVYGFGNPIQLDEPFLNSLDVPILDSVISLIVQAFYCWRIYFLRKGMVIPILILIVCPSLLCFMRVYSTPQVSLAQSSAGILTGVRNYQIGHLSLSSEYIVTETIWLAGGAVADLAIAVVLAWTLLSGRNGSRPAYNSMLSRLIRLIVETKRPHRRRGSGSYCAVLGISWNCAGLSPNRDYREAVRNTPYMYTNCLLALFNNRTREAAKSMNSHGLVSLHASPNSTSQPTSNSHPESLKVHVMSQVDMSYESQMELGNIGKRRPIIPTLIKMGVGEFLDLMSDIQAQGHPTVDN
ncbi:hypothetical protein B0H13DRAFT_2324953 [Mycena leptocephala]|nr:hypothetical protein B0H13DRAFT_2324953 [Mycena leptocephala]